MTRVSLPENTSYPVKCQFRYSYDRLKWRTGCATSYCKAILYLMVIPLEVNLRGFRFSRTWLKRREPVNNYQKENITNGERKHLRKISSMLFLFRTFFYT